MADLDRLRQTITPEQRPVLNLLWQEFRDRNCWLPRVEIHNRLGAAAVQRTVAALGTAIVRPGSEDGVEDYRLTLLGVLLADEGSDSEALLVRYLEYVRERVRADAKLEWVGSREVETALQLAPERSRHLRQLIRLSHWWGGGSGFGQRDWTVGIPVDVEELPESDLRDYVRQHVLTHFLPAAPGAGLAISPLPLTPPRPPFGFLRDHALAARLAADWHEAQDVCEVRGWKSCVLLCGGILEAMLRGVLGVAPGAPPDGLPVGLAALVQAVARNRLLPGPLTLTPAIENYRSLLGPDAGATVTRDDADTALEAVRTCLHHLPARADR